MSCELHNYKSRSWYAFFTVVILSFCVSTLSSAQEADDSGTEWEPERPITLIVPSNPGGGWDQTARFMQRAIIEEDLLDVSLDVVNRGGAGGTIALAELVEQFEGASDKLMVTGFGMVGSALMHESDYSLESVTPIARLTGEYQVIAVSEDSPYQTIGDLMKAFQSDPKSISWAGGSAGGSDQIFIVQVAEALGISPADVNYVAFTGGGEANAALMGNQVTAGITGFGEISGIAESGRVRLLAVSSQTRLVDPDLPTFIESGVDVTFQNWRGIVAPPGISEAEKSYYVKVIGRAHKSKFWQNALELNDWQDSYMVDPDFAQFITANKEKTRRTLASMGIGKSSEISAIGPYFFPNLVGLGLLLSGAFILVPLFAARSKVAVTDSREVEMDAGPTWLGFGVTAGLCLLYILALGLVGFLIATPLFIFGISQIIDRGNWIRDIVIALALTGSIYGIFEHLLQVNVP